MSKQKVEILLPIALDYPLTYLVPEGMNLRLGSLVEVPIRSRYKVGVVWTLDSSPKDLNQHLKYILRHRDDLKPLPKDLLAFIEWSARYYLVDKGLFLKLCLSNDLLMKGLPTKTLIRVTNPNTPSSLTTKQTKILSILQSEPDITLAALLEKSNCSRAVLTSLEKKGWVKKESHLKAIERTDPSSIQLTPTINFTTEQQSILHQLRQLLAQKPPRPILLEGQTGSGKTEIYFESIAKALENPQNQILVIVPEIILTSQLLARFTKRFGFSPLIWHSDISQTKRRQIWHGVNQGQVRLILGARSALFLPFQQLSLIIADEEQDSGYKQEDHIPYHARDLAVIRGYYAKSNIILASATPSLESYYNVKKHKYDHIHLTQRYAKYGMPELHFIDLKDAMSQSPKTRQSLLSPAILKALENQLIKKEQSLIFLNRKGYAPSLFCRSCHHIVMCPSCSVSMVWHEKEQQMHCHQCGYKMSKPDACPECGAVDSFIPIGVGLERVEDAIKKAFPQATRLMITRETIQHPTMRQEAIQAIENNAIDIILGTQIITKGHHFPDLTMVAILDADMTLQGGDYRAAERTYQQLYQVVGRAGRENKKGEVYVQTLSTANMIMEALKQHDGDIFLKQELDLRRLMDMPPYVKLATLTFMGKNESKVIAYAKEVQRFLHHLDVHVSVQGPVAASVKKVKYYYRYRLLLKAKKNMQIQTLLAKLKPYHQTTSIKMYIDIDPVTVH